MEITYEHLVRKMQELYPREVAHAASQCQVEQLQAQLAELRNGHKEEEVDAGV